MVIKHIIRIQNRNSHSVTAVVNSKSAAAKRSFKASKLAILVKNGQITCESEDLYQESKQYANLE